MKEAWIDSILFYAIFGMCFYQCKAILWSMQLVRKYSFIQKPVREFFTSFRARISLFCCAKRAERFLNIWKAILIRIVVFYHLKNMGFKSKLAGKDLEKAQRELNEDPKTRDKAIKSLLTKCKTSRKIPSVCWPRLDDGFLLRFLRVSKFDLDKAVDRLEKYFELQKEWPELYGYFSSWVTETTCI